MMSPALQNPFVHLKWEIRPNSAYYKLVGFLNKPSVVQGQ